MKVVTRQHKYFFFFLLFLFVDLFACSLPFMSESIIATLNISGARDLRKRAVTWTGKTKTLMLRLFKKHIVMTRMGQGMWRKKLFLVIKHLWVEEEVCSSREVFVPHFYSVESIVEGWLLKVRAVFEQCVFVFMCVYAPSSGIDRLLFLD